MTTASLAESASRRQDFAKAKLNGVVLCDCCRRVQNADGRWEIRGQKALRVMRSIVLDFCPDCSARYVSLLLKPACSWKGFRRMLFPDRKFRVSGPSNNASTLEAQPPRPALDSPPAWARKAAESHCSILPLRHVFAFGHSPAARA